MGEVRTNVIYLTTHCNLDCGYCYEKKNREATGFVHRTITSAEIDAFVEEVSAREHDNSSCVVIFGGEPLLQPQLVQELMDKFMVRKASSGVHFDLVTNGTLITPAMATMLTEYQRKLPSLNCSLQIEVSYDGVGQAARTFVGGKSSAEAVMVGIKNLHDAGAEICISYVAHPLNINSVLRDIATAIIAMKVVKVSIRYATTDLQAMGVDVEKFRTDLRPRLLALYQRFGIPICDEVCELCDRCHKGKAGNNYCIPGDGIVKFETLVNEDFNHFLRGQQ